MRAGDWGRSAPCVHFGHPLSVHVLHEKEHQLACLPPKNVQDVDSQFLSVSACCPLVPAHAKLAQQASHMHGRACSTGQSRAWATARQSADAKQHSKQRYGRSQLLHCLVAWSSPALHALVEHRLALVSRAQLLRVELHSCLAALHALLIDLQQRVEVAAELLSLSWHGGH